MRLPPLFDEASVVLAWPEIGFPETVLRLPLPDRATVERDTVSVWDAPLTVHPVPGSLRHLVHALPPEEPAIETGRIAAAPRVLNRGEHAVVVLNRLTAVGGALAMEVLSSATGEPADEVATAAVRLSHRPPAGAGDPVRMRTEGPGAAIAVTHHGEAGWLQVYEASYGGGDGVFESEAEFVFGDPGGDVLDLVVAWPAAGLADVRVEIPLSRS